MKKKLLRWTAVMLLVLGTLITLFYAVENWRGARAWKEMEAQLRAISEPLTIAELVPAPVPDDRNVAMAAIFQEVFAYDKATKETISKQEMPPVPRIQQINKVINELNSKPNVLPSYAYGRIASIPDFTVLEKFKDKNGALLSEIRQALDRPQINWNHDYSLRFSLSVPHLGSIMDLGKYYQLEALDHMDSGRSDLALEDIRYIQRLSEIAKKDPFLMENLVSMTVNSVNGNTIWAGLQRRAWNEKQILELQDLATKKSDEFSDYQKGLRWERTTFLQATQGNQVEFLERMTSLNELSSFSWESLLTMTYFFLRPKGWMDMDRGLYSGWMQRYIELCGKFGKGLSGLEEFRKLDEEFLSKSGDVTQRLMTPMTFLAFPALSGVFKRSIETENLNRMIQIACSLERYRLATGKIPASLEVLVPKYLSALPLDIVNGEPLKFVGKNGEDYLLYSVGLNGTDDGGYTSKDRNKGDWVWPSKPGLVEVRDK